MQLIAPDILVEARGLSLPFCLIGMAIGALLWVFGWRWHRFWVVLTATISAGLVGLSAHAAISPRMLAAGLLLALAAGMLAIDLSRCVVFAASGLACWLAVHKILPAFHEPLICFLVGGIIGLFLYRLHLMILTSLAGAVIFLHSLILLFEKSTEMRFWAADWADNNGLGLNITVVAVAVIGVAIQGQLERWRERNETNQGGGSSHSDDLHREHFRRAPRRSSGGFWGLFRKAG